jgi:hypothetical protein
VLGFTLLLCFLLCCGVCPQPVMRAPSKVAPGIELAG